MNSGDLHMQHALCANTKVASMYVANAMKIWVYYGLNENTTASIASKTFGKQKVTSNLLLQVACIMQVVTNQVEMLISKCRMG